jgi:hypothetical protein
MLRRLLFAIILAALAFAAHDPNATTPAAPAGIDSAAAA